MPTRNIKPLHVLWQRSRGVGMLDGISSGIREILSLAGVFKEIKVEYLGKRRQPDWRNQENISLTPYQSLDWHIEWARKNSKKAGYLNSRMLLDSLKDNPTCETEPRYELVVVNEPLHWSHTSLRTVSGIGRKGQGAIITVEQHLPLLQPVIGESDENKKERGFRFLLSTQMLAMHELGHIFGLLPGTSKENPTDEELKEAHCLNDCVMYWRENVDLNSRIKDKPFCPSCLEKLKKFFLVP